MLLTNEEVEVLKGQGEWADDYSAYKLPPFILKSKKLNFLKLPAIQGS